MDPIASSAAKATRKSLALPRRVLGVGLYLARQIGRRLWISPPNNSEALIASAFANAKRNGLGSICMFLSFNFGNEDISKLLDDPRVASVGIQDNPLATELSVDLDKDSRIGRYWGPGEWTLPVPATDVYFLGPWSLITTNMLREALRCETTSLRVRIAIFWVPVPLGIVRAIARLPRPARGTLLHLLRAPRRIWSKSQSIFASVVTFAYPNANAIATKSGQIRGLPDISLETAFERMLDAGVPLADPVQGRIVHVCGNLQPGGAERQLVYVLRGLARHNFESLRLLCHSLRPDTSDRRDFYLNAVRTIGIEVREIRRKATASAMPAGLREIVSVLPSGLALDIANLYWEFVEIKPQVVHAWLDWDNVRSGLAATLAGVPNVILSGRNLNPSHFALYQSYMDPAYRVLARRSNVTLVNNSRAGADDYSDWIGIARDKIRVIHNGVELGPRTPAWGLRANLGIPADAFVIGGVFRLEAEKRPLLWIKTAGIVAQRVPAAWFVVFGQGSMEEEMRAAASRYGFDKRLIMPGLTDDISSVMSAIDVLLLTSSAEGLPNVLLEAQWYGTPVVTTNVGGAGEAIDAGLTGWAISSDRADDLAQQVAWVHANPEFRSGVRDSGPAFVRRKFGVERMVDETAALYKRG